MNTSAVLNSQFVTVALPIVLTIFLTGWMNSRAFDQLGKRMDDIIARLGRIETKMDAHEKAITQLDERTSPFRR